MLYWNTINDPLKNSLILLMKAEVFKPFRLVGGTSLSLQLGHRMSVDLDLFTDAPYRSIDFNAIDNFLKSNYAYVDALFDSPIAFGRSYMVGSDRYNSIKLDVFYTDEFIQKPLTIENVRMATVEEILAMKIDVVQRGGRKKDFWDIHELIDKYTIDQMLALHEQRYSYNHNRNLILKNMKDFEVADLDFDPICLKAKHWELIKLDILEEIEKY